ncbi:MAG TPA: WD40 repeat domain-containing protein, partial [Chthoniobacterales bacterium]|nr:WD40 repeat domain-containing protein [Chthoniobacterales bacterium]
DRTQLAVTANVGERAWIELRRSIDASASARLALPDGDPALLAFSSKGDLAIAVGESSKIARRICLVPAGATAPTLQHEFRQTITAVAFSPDGRSLTVASENSGIRFLEGLRGEPRWLLGHEERVGDIAFLPGGEALVSVSNDGTLRQWMAGAGPVSRVQTEYSWLHPTASSDGRRLAYVDPENRVACNMNMVFPEGHHPLGALRDGRVLTRIGASGEVVMWQTDADAPRELWRAQGIPSHPGYAQIIRGMVLRDERLAAGLIPGKLLVVDLEKHTVTGTPDQRMLFGASGVNCLDLSPDGKLIAVTGFLGRRVRIYRTEDVNGGYVSLGDAADYDTAAAFHPDGRRLFVGNEDGFVRVFDVATRKELPNESWHAHAGGVTAIAVSRSGKIVATSGDTTLRLWDVESPRRERLRIPVETPRNWMQFTDDDAALLHSAPEHTLEVWEAKAR